MTATESAQRRHDASYPTFGSSPSGLGSQPAGVHPPSPQAVDPDPAMMPVANAAGVMAGEVDQWTRRRAQARSEFLSGVRHDVANLHAILQARQALLTNRATGAHPAGSARHARTDTPDSASVGGDDWNGRPQLRALPMLADEAPSSADAFIGYMEPRYTEPAHIQVDPSVTASPVAQYRAAVEPVAPYAGAEPVVPYAAAPPLPPEPPTLTLVDSEPKPLATAQAGPPYLTGDVKTVHVYQTTASAKSRARSDKKIERSMAKWQGRGYVLTEMDDQRSGDASVLKAVLTFHRPA
jgi:hypothetical protein